MSNAKRETGKPKDTHRWVAVFEQRADLEATLEDLNKAGFDHHELSLLVKHQPEATQWNNFNPTAVPIAPLGGPVFVDTKWAEHWSEAKPAPSPKNPNTKIKKHHDVNVRSADALKTNTLAGAIIGMIAGAAVTLIPGIGPVLGVGIIAAELGALSAGAAIGGAAGGLLGLFQDKGLPAEHAKIYSKALNEGKLLLFVEAHCKDRDSEKSRLAAAERILAAHVPEALYPEK